MNNKNNTNSMEDEHGNHDNQGQFENKRYSHFSSKNAWASALSTASVTSQANNTQMYPNQNFLMIQPYVLQYGEIYFTPTPYFQTRTPAQIFEGEPFIRLTIVKARDSSLINQQFFIKNTGMLGTRKNTIINDIVIGRNIFYGLTNPNINPLDIAINDQHGFISPIHGKFIFEDAFKNRGYIYPTFLSFLMMSHPRLGYYSPGRNLPRHLYQHIYSFLLPKRALYIQDAGSQSGTFVKIPYSIPFRMSNNSRVLVGLHAEFNIIDMHDSETVGKINSKELALYLHLSKVTDSVLHLSEAKLEEFNKRFLLFRTNFLNNPEALKMLANFHEDVYYMLLQFTTNKPTDQTEYCFIISKKTYASDEKAISMGRAHTCDFTFDHASISRKQLSIWRQGGNWFIRDGDGSKESANGTWVDIRKTGDQEGESQPYEISHKTEFKMGECIFRVELSDNFQNGRRIQCVCVSGPSIQASWTD
eukprot:TRINITY_DN5083_c0_g1_i3.p1 TRINITY_DN5083_c0_g1~~TRINITY_DN5083_c0_g1_i3.p1  ORF type:complete len:474 (+),score=158.32 TRINITY_DN5083_c0_g1_i3:611-2032(+)